MLTISVDYFLSYLQYGLTELNFIFSYRWLSFNLVIILVYFLSILNKQEKSKEVPLFACSCSVISRTFFVVDAKLWHFFSNLHSFDGDFPETCPFFLYFAFHPACLYGCHPVQTPVWTFVVVEIHRHLQCLPYFSNGMELYVNGCGWLLFVLLILRADLSFT